MKIIPVLDARDDALSCDYPDGRYRCNMTTVRRGHAIRAHHILDGTDELHELVAHGMARFAVEIISSATFRSSLQLAPEGATSHTFDLDAATVAKDDAQARPGLVAVRDCTLPVIRLSPAWRDIGGTVAVQAGQWLARGQHAELTSPQTSLLRFVPDAALRRYEMRCRFAHPGYEIEMNPDDLAECQQNEGQPAAKTVMLAAWVAALADASKRSAFGGRDEHLQAIAQRCLQAHPELIDWDTLARALGPMPSGPTQSGTSTPSRKSRQAKRQKRRRPRR